MLSVRTKSNLTRLAKILTGPVFILILWQFVYELKIFDSSLFPKPIDAFRALWEMTSSGKILPDLRDTVLRMLAGFGLATIFGVALGLLLGSFTPMFESAEIVIDFFRSIPVTTLYPVFVLIYGIGDLSKIGMIFWASFFVITLNSAYGVIHSTKVRAGIVKLYGASPSQIFRWITFYDALPQTLIGLRVAISFSLIISILCEMFMGSKYGIGQLITDAFTTYQIDKLFALIIISGLLGYFFNRIFVFFEKKLVPWVGK